MRLGVAYDLRADYLAQGMSREDSAEFDSEITIAALCAALEGLGYDAVRIGNLRALNARLVAGDAILMGGDMPTPDPAHRKGFSVNIQLKDEAEGERIFKALSDGGSVAMPFEKTFWAAKFGMVTDRYGTPWMVNCDASH